MVMSHLLSHYVNQMHPGISHSSTDH